MLVCLQVAPGEYVLHGCSLADNEERFSMRGKLSGLEGKVSLRQQYDELSDDDSPTFWTAAVSEVGGDWSEGTWSCAQPIFSFAHSCFAFDRLTTRIWFQG